MNVVQLSIYIIINLSIIIDRLVIISSPLLDEVDLGREHKVEPVCDFLKTSGSCRLGGMFIFCGLEIC